MTEGKRYGAVMVLQAGAPEIAGALAEGIMKGRAATAAAGTSSGPAGHLPQRGRLFEGERRVVEAEIDRQAICEGVNAPNVDRALLRVAVGNHKTPEDYANMRFQAEMAYGEPVDEPTPLRRALDKALVIYAMFVEAVAGAYRAQDKVLEER